MVKCWSSGLWVNAPYDISRRIRSLVTPILVYQLVNSCQEQKIYFDRQINLINYLDLLLNFDSL